MSETEHPEQQHVEQLAAATAEALAPTERRLEVERLQQTNDAALQRLAGLGVAVSRDDIIGVRLSVLVECLFGDMDTENRTVYEFAVQRKFAELIAEVESQATRARLLNGVRLDLPKHPPRG